MLPLTLKVKTREESGKGPSSRTRVTGEIPGVLYGDGKDVVHLCMNTREFGQLVSGGGEHAVVQLEVANKPDLSGPALLKDVQHHPVQGHYVHADFMRIRLDQRIVTRVPVIATGQSKGVVDGGVIDQQLREIEVECLALEVPESITVEISGLGIGDSLHVSDLVAPEGVRFVTDAHRPVVAVHAPRTVKVEGVEGEAVAGAAEPELVGGEAKKEEGDEKTEKKEKDSKK